MCGHILCDTCLPGISRGADETVRCPECRKDCDREDVEQICHTESQRWDALLDVAKAWASFDKRGEDETSEEEAFENFIDDDDGTRLVPFP